MMSLNVATKRSTRKNLGFYTSAQASRIAIVPNWTLDNWKRNGIILPTIKWADEFDKEHLGYTFETVIFMRLLRILREKHISLHKAVEAMEQLKRRFGSPSKRWADAKIFVDSEDAFVYEERDRDGWGITVATKYNQRVAEFIFGHEFTLLRDRADALLIPSRFLDFVEIDPSIQNGLPIVIDTTILTSTIHDLSAQAYKPEDIHKLYPFISITKIAGAEDYETFLDKGSLN